MKTLTSVSVLFVALTLLLFAMPLQAQTTWYVDDDAPGDPGPGDPSISDPLENGNVAHPYDAIQEGIDAAVNGDTVLVADGTYTGDGNRDIDFLGKAITVRSENGPDNCVVDMEDGNHRGFQFHSGESTASRLEGMTITNNTIYFGPDGGGIYCAGSSPAIIGNVITDCWGGYGGGVYVSNGSPAIEGNTISDNGTFFASYMGDGGGICVKGEGAATIRDNQIIDNRSEGHGGGIYSNQDAVIIENNRVNQNICTGDVYGGGGICLIGGPGALVAFNEISGNVASAPWHGGLGGGILCSPSAGATPLIIGNRIIGNQAHSAGGGLCCFLFSPLSVGEATVCANNLIIGNEANGTSGEGGGVFCENTSVSVINSTIAGNTANTDGGGIRCNDTQIQIHDSIIWGNTATSDPSISLYGTSTISVAHSDIEGGWAGPGNIDDDPLFVSGPDGDYYLSQTAAGQGVDSPCVDSGQTLAAGTCWQMPDGITCLSNLTTRTDRVNDQGTADMGYHYPSLGPISAWLSCQPSSGTLPFSTQLAMGIDNELAGEFRKVSGRLNVLLGNGTSYPNWRAGYLVLSPGQTYSLAWLQEIPAISKLLGDNRFTFAVADVTPAPYNQPPYSPSGSTDWARCTVTGVAP